MLSIFSCAFYTSVCLLWRNVYLDLPPFFDWVVCLLFLILSHMICLYILEIDPLSVALFANILSQPEGCLFVLFTVSFFVQKFLSFIRSHLFIFVFIFINLGGRLKKILLRFMSKSVLPMFSSKSFTVSGLTFGSLIPMEFIFVYGVRECFINLFYLFIYFWRCLLFISVRGLSLVAASGGHSSSRCVGLSLSWPLLLRSTGSRRAGSLVVAHWPNCSVACGIFPDQGSNPCPLHWQADSQ